MPEADQSRTYQGVWREPGEESHIYPGICVCDDRVTGSITAGCTRLPLWAFNADLIAGGYDHASDDYNVAEYISQDDLSAFMYYLLEARGEFGRLLCTLAEVERQDGERQDAWCAENATDDGLVIIDPAEPRTDPGPWWAHADLRQMVREQLRNCLDALDQEEREPTWPPTRTPPTNRTGTHV